MFQDPCFCYISQKQQFLMKWKVFTKNSFIIVSTFYWMFWNKTQTEARTLDCWRLISIPCLHHWSTDLYLCLELKMPIIRSSLRAPQKMLEIYFWHVRLKIPGFRSFIKNLSHNRRQEGRRNVSPSLNQAFILNFLVSKGYQFKSKIIQFI